MIQHGFKQIDSSEEQTPEVQSDETEADGASVFYENAPGIILYLDVIWDDDVLFFGAHSAYWLRGGTRGTNGVALKVLMSPQAAAPADPQEYAGWKCPTPPDVEQKLDAIAAWLAQNPTFLAGQPDQ